MAEIIRLGVLGYNEGNGHPYSWSAIINGYDPRVLSTCPYPIIIDYLSRKKYPDDFISGARVTHIWTQDPIRSRHIAETCFIETVVDSPEDLVGQVDGVLLARDDVECHLGLSEPFLKAGLPVYIDKPLSTTVAEAKRIYSLERYEGQIFTCSALRFAHEFQLSASERKDLGQILHIDACVMKNWPRYGVHVLEPVLSMLRELGPATEIRGTHWRDRTTVNVRWAGGVDGSFSCLGRASSPISIRLFAESGFREMVFIDTFAAFKNALSEFISCIRGTGTPIRKDFVLEVVRILEGGAS
jgi:hypothetical protein